MVHRSAFSRCLKCAHEVWERLLEGETTLPTLRPRPMFIRGGSGNLTLHVAHTSSSSSSTSSLRPFKTFEQDISVLFLAPEVLVRCDMLGKRLGFPRSQLSNKKEMGRFHKYDQHPSTTQYVCLSFNRGEHATPPHPTKNVYIGRPNYLPLLTTIGTIPDIYVTIIVGITSGTLGRPNAVKAVSLSQLV